jgi:hypothetical protein
MPPFLRASASLLSRRSLQEPFSVALGFSVMHTSAMHTGCHDVDDSLFLFSPTVVFLYYHQTLQQQHLQLLTNPRDYPYGSASPQQGATRSSPSGYPQAAFGACFLKFCGHGVGVCSAFFRWFLSRRLFRRIGRFPQQLVAVSWWFKNAACPHRRDRKASEAKGTQLSYHSIIGFVGMALWRSLVCFV